jgi:hypothetical protein
VLPKLVTNKREFWWLVIIYGRSCVYPHAAPAWRPHSLGSLPPRYKKALMIERTSYMVHQFRPCLVLMEVRQVSFKSAKRRHVVSRRDGFNVLGSAAPPPKNIILWFDYYYGLDSDKKKAMHHYVIWEILLPICIFTFLRTFRPGNAYLVLYLTRFKGINEETVNTLYLSWKVYIYMPMIGIAGYLYSKRGYRWVFPLELLFQAIFRILFIFGQGDSAFVIAYVCYGFGLAGEAVFYLYRTALIQDSHKLLVTSISSFTLYLAMFLSALFSQLYLGTEADLDSPERINHLFGISTLCILLACFFGFWFLPGTEKSLVYDDPDIRTTEAGESRSANGSHPTCRECCETNCCPTNPKTDDNLMEITIRQLESKIDLADKKRACCKSADESCVCCFTCMESCCCDSRYKMFRRLEESEESTDTSPSPSPVTSRVSPDARILLHPDDSQDDDSSGSVLFSFLHLCESVKSLFLQKDGLFWATIWCALMVTQYSTDGDMLLNWLDADSRSPYYGLAEAMGSLTAGCGALIPPFVVKLIKHLSSTRDSQNAEESLSRGEMWFASVCSLIAAGLNIAQYFHRDIFFLYGFYGFHQMILTMASVIAASRLTMV